MRLPHVPFAELMERPDVVELADRLGSDMSTPDWLYKFMALTMVCMVAEPEQDMGDSYAASGVCVFYAPEYEPGETTPVRYAPWTCEMTICGSQSYTFTKLGDGTQCLSEDDSWHVTTDGSRPVVGWQQRTMDLLATSLWRPLNDAALFG